MKIVNDLILISFLILLALSNKANSKNSTSLSKYEKIYRTNGYKLIKRIGYGGYGDIYLSSYNNSPNDTFAVKEIRKCAKYIKYIQNEVEILTKLSLSNNKKRFLTLHDLFQSNMAVMMVMRLMKNDVYNIVTYSPINSDNLTFELIIYIIKEIALALKDLKAIHIVHNE